MSRRAATAGSRPGATRSGSPRADVPLTTAQRFAARVRARRRHRLAVAALLAGVLLAAGWLAVLSPWATVRRVQVAGVARIPAEVVREAARAQLGRPLLLADAGSVAARVRAERLVKAATVTRRWPSTLLVTVVERVAVAAVPAAGGVLLVDGDGVEVARAAAAPSGLPVLDLDLGRAGASALRACLRVLADLPGPLSRQVVTVGADSADGVWLVLAGGGRVRWGSADQNAQKAQVLQVLLRQRASTYDVSAPEAPALVTRP